ncbi:MAG: ParA family protein [Myxococcota bacterium]|nr:ParA family protein [Myxococcota bacterium]
MIITLASQKGGVGKSTVAMALTAELYDRGFKVLLADCDWQCTALTWREVGDESQVDGPAVIHFGQGFHHPDQIPTQAQIYDFIILDTPGRSGDIQRLAMGLSDLVLLPCGPTSADAWALADTLAELNKGRLINPNLIARILISKADGRTNLGKTAGDIFSNLDVALMESRLSYLTAFQEFPATGKGLVAFTGKSHKAAKELIKLTDEILDTLHIKEGRRAA